MAAVLEKMRDYQALVTDEVVETKYIPHSQLKYIDHADEWPISAISYPLLGIEEHEGVILMLVGVVRKDLGSGGFAEVWQDDMGREISSREYERLPDQARRRVTGPYKCWDFRVREVVVTDGPQARAELMESYEQAKRRARTEEKERQTSEVSLADAISKLADRLNTVEETTGRAKK